MCSDSRSRKWQITINNPADKGFTHEQIQKLLASFKNCVYYCFSDKVGKDGTFHTHIFFYCTNAVRFSAVKCKFDGGHFEMANGTCQQNRDYVFKEGKWIDDKKADTNIRDSHVEYGDVPVERQGSRNDIETLYDCIKDGYSNLQIIDEMPQYLFNVDGIEKARQMLREEEYKEVFRDVKVTYIYGDTGTGKTRGIMDKYGYTGVYRVTDYSHPWDNYKGEKVVIFEEFRSSLKFADMLVYLDGYPVSLPCRYANRFACFDTVFIVSNIPLNEQYRRLAEGESLAPFYRRISSVKRFTSDYIYTYLSVDDYNKGFCFTIANDINVKNELGDLSDYDIICG